jgi:hypothetical protein
MPARKECAMDKRSADECPTSHEGGAASKTTMPATTMPTTTMPATTKARLGRGRYQCGTD